MRPCITRYVPKQLKIYEGNAVHFNYGVPGEVNGSWLLLNPLELDSGETLQVVHESDYIVEEADLSEHGANYVYYNYLVYADTVASMDHFAEAVRHTAETHDIIDLMRLAMAQLRYGLHEAMEFAEAAAANPYLAAREHYLKAKVK